MGDLSESVQQEDGALGLEAAGKRVYRVAPPLLGEGHSAKNGVWRQMSWTMQHKR